MQLRITTYREKQNKKQKVVQHTYNTQINKFAIYSYHTNTLCTVATHLHKATKQCRKDIKILCKCNNADTVSENGKL